MEESSPSNRRKLVLGPLMGRACTHARTILAQWGRTCTVWSCSATRWSGWRGGRKSKGWVPTSPR
eukprot:1121698-Prorocentrum_minimum.AAC.1